jgi:hypothetical protein
MDADEKIEENLEEIAHLKKGNLYCLEQIKNSNESWEKKEYKKVILENNKKIRKLAEHNRKLGRFK